MQEMARHLLDVLKETLVHQERICTLMEHHKQLLIDGKELDAQAVLDEIDDHSQKVIESEVERQKIVADIARLSSVDAAHLTADSLLELPLLLSVREELTTTTTKLREVLQRIIRLRDEIQVLAQHAKAYSDMMLNALHEAVSQPQTYGKNGAVGASFFSVRT